MDLRKNVPVVPGKNETPPPAKGAKKAFFQLIGGLATVMFLLFHFGTGTSKTPQNNPPPQKVAEANVQSPQSPQSPQPQQQIPDVNKPQKKISDTVTQSNNKPQPKPAAQPKPVAQPKPAPQPKPVAQLQPKPPTPRPSNVVSSSGRTTGLLKKVVTAGKVGLFLITKGKVKIR